MKKRKSQDRLRVLNWTVYETSVGTSSFGGGARIAIAVFPDSLFVPSDLFRPSRQTEVADWFS